MSIPEGTHTIGPSNGSLKVKTGKEGAAAKMGHDLVLVVNSWEATVEGGDSPSIKLTADPGSVEVESGAGRRQAARRQGQGRHQEEHRRQGPRLVADHVHLQRGDRQQRQGRPLDRRHAARRSSIPISVSGDKISGSHTLSQKDFGIKQFSAMMGALKVKDQVTVEFEGSLS